MASSKTKKGHFLKRLENRITGLTKSAPKKADNLKNTNESGDAQDSNTTSPAVNASTAVASNGEDPDTAISVPSATAINPPMRSPMATSTSTVVPQLVTPLISGTSSINPPVPDQEQAIGLPSHTHEEATKPKEMSLWDRACENLRERDTKAKYVSKTPNFHHNLRLPEDDCSKCCQSHRYIFNYFFMPFVGYDVS